MKIAPGVRYILLSTLCFAVINIGVKALSNPIYFGFQKIPAHELVLFRSVISFIICFVMLKRARLPLLGYQRKWLMIRGVFGTAALTLFFITLQNMDLSMATILQYLSPIFTLGIAMVLFKEKIHWGQWIMILIAFVGVGFLAMYKLDVKEGRFIWLIMGISSALFSGIAYNAIIKCKHTDSPLNVVIYFPMVAIPVMGVWCFFEFVTPSGVEWLIVLGIGLLTQLAQVFMTKALHSSMAGEVVPFKYLGAVYALLMGYVVFDERLHQLSLTGMVLIILGVMGTQWLKNKPFKKGIQNP